MNCLQPRSGDIPLAPGVRGCCSTQLSLLQPRSGDISLATSVSWWVRICGRSAGGTADLSSLRDFTLARSESHQLTLVASEVSPLRGWKTPTGLEQQPREPGER